MTTARRRVRIVVKRGARLYSLCGTARTMRPPSRLGWLPGAALVMVVVFSVFALAYKPVAPDGEQHRLPLVQVAHYTAEDFFTSAR